MRGSSDCKLVGVAFLAMIIHSIHGSPPNILYSIFGEKNQMNIPVQLIISKTNVKSTACEYIVHFPTPVDLDVMQNLFLDGDAVYYGLNLDGVIMFYDLKLTKPEVQNNQKAGGFVFQSEKGVMPVEQQYTQRRNLVHVYYKTLETSNPPELLFTIIAIGDPQQIAPTIFKVNYHRNYGIGNFFTVTENRKNIGIVVLMTDENDEGLLVFEYPNSAKPRRSVSESTPVYVNVFAGIDRKFQAQYTGALEENPPNSGYVYIIKFTRKPVLEDVDRFTVSSRLGSCNYNPLNSVKLKLIQGDTYGVEPRLQLPMQVHQWKGERHLVLIHSDRPMTYVITASGKLECKIHGVEATRIQYFQTHTFTIIIKGSRVYSCLTYAYHEETFGDEVDIYFEPVHDPVDKSEIKSLEPNERILLVKRGNLLELFVLVELPQGYIKDDKKFNIVPRYKLEAALLDSLTDDRKKEFKFFLSTEDNKKERVNELEIELNLLAGVFVCSLKELKENTNRQGLSAMESHPTSLLPTTTSTSTRSRPSPWSIARQFPKNCSILQELDGFGKLVQGEIPVETVGANVIQISSEFRLRILTSQNSAFPKTYKFQEASKVIFVQLANSECVHESEKGMEVTYTQVKEPKKSQTPVIQLYKAEEELMILETSYQVIKDKMNLGNVGTSVEKFTFFGTPESLSKILKVNFLEYTILVVEAENKWIKVECSDDNRNILSFIKMQGGSFQSFVVTNPNGKNINNIPPPKVELHSGLYDKNRYEIRFKLPDSSVNFCECNSEYRVECKSPDIVYRQVVTYECPDGSVPSSNSYFRPKPT